MPGRVAPAVTLVALLVACGASRSGSPVGQAGSSSVAGAPGVGGQGNASGAAGDGGTGTAGGGSASGGQANAGAAGGGAPNAGAPPLPPIEVGAPDAQAECDPELCVVVSDWDLVETARYGIEDFHVATSADTTFVALTTSGAEDRRRLVALDASGEVSVDQGQVGRTAIAGLAVDAGGSLRFAGVRGRPPGSDEPVLVHEGILTGTTWSHSTLDQARWSLGLEIDPSQRSLVHAEDSAGAPLLLARGGDDPSSLTSLPAGFEERALALDARGAPTFSLASDSTLSVLDEAGNAIFTQALPSVSTGDLPMMKVAPGQPFAIDDGSDLAFAALGEDGLHVLLGDRGGGNAVDVTVPSTAAAAFTCPLRAEGTGSGCGAECAPPCRSSGSGLTPISIAAPASSSAFALARTDDGALWLAYLASDLELTVNYVWGNTGAGCSTCGAVGGTTQGSTELKVVRIAPDGSSLQEALSAPVVIVGPDPNGSAQLLVRARAFGRRVALAVVQERTVGSGLRVVTLEASE
jgi:hypothetical protein